jgi:hypothetical protein
VSDAQMAELYERLTAAKRPHPDAIFLRGWNAGLDKAIKEARLAFDDPALEEPAEDRP